MAGIPELGGGADDVGFGVHQHVLDERIGFQLGAAGIALFEREQFDGAVGTFLERLHLGAAAVDAALGQDRRLLLFNRLQRVEEAGGGKAERGGRFAGGPNIDQPVERILALLNALLVADGAGLGAFGSAEALALVADDRLDGGEQLGRRHQADATRVRLKTASITSPWLKLGTMTPSLTV